MLTSRYRVVRAIGTAAFALLMLMSVRRTKWFLGRGVVPATRIELRAPLAVTEADVRLCERLIDAHGRAVSDRPQENATEGMWSWIFDARQQGLAEALEKGDPRELADLMASMFARDFVLGMAPGPLLRQADSRLASRAWGLKCLDGLASLAEVLGVVAVENPEQGRAGLAFDGGAGDLIRATEDQLGFRIDFPNVGAAGGLLVQDRLITPDTPDQIYAALRLQQAIDLHLGDERNPDGDRVVEIGGGYGSMCFWFSQLHERLGSYTIVDLPIVNVLQGYFLGKALGPDRISLYGEELSQVRIAPDFALDRIESPCDAYVNKDSLPEMPHDTMVDYLKWGADNCGGIFYSYNQEAAMEFLGEAQGVVHKAASSLGGFERLRRDRAWVRDGYVEEIYVPRTARR